MPCVVNNTKIMSFVFRELVPFHFILGRRNFSLTCLLTRTLFIFQDTYIDRVGLQLPSKTYNEILQSI